MLDGDRVFLLSGDLYTFGGITLPSLTDADLSTGSILILSSLVLEHVSRVSRNRICVGSTSVAHSRILPCSRCVSLTMIRSRRRILSRDNQHHISDEAVLDHDIVLRVKMNLVLPLFLQEHINKIAVLQLFVQDNVDHKGIRGHQAVPLFLRNRLRQQI